MWMSYLRQVRGTPYKRICGLCRLRLNGSMALCNISGESMSFNDLRIYEQTLINEQDTAKLYEVVHKVRRICPDVPDEKQTSTGYRTEVTTPDYVCLGTLTSEDGAEGFFAGA